jgi:hypothetical protein
VAKNNILSQISVENLTEMLADNSDFKIKRKNHEEVRIFSYDKPNKFRSDTTSLFEVLLNNRNLAKSRETLSITFTHALNEA